MKQILLIILSILFTLNSFSQQLTTRNITHDATTREYLEYIPASYTGNDSVPVVFALHGLGDNMNNFYGIGLDNIADTANFILIVPQALMATYMGQNIGTAWNSGASLNGITPNQNVDDVGFMMAILDSLNNYFNIDNSKIFFTGFSMGGYMSNKMACEKGDKINAIASVSGTIGINYSPNPINNIACLHIHGDNDQVVQYSGNQSGMDAEELVDFWVNHNNNDTTPVVYNYPDAANDGLSFTRHVYPNGNEQVAFIKVNNGAHSWYYEPQNDISYIKEIWKFFSTRFSETLLNAEPKEAIEASIFPNPASDFIRIKFKKYESDYQVFLKSIDGRKVKTWYINGKDRLLNINNVPSGIYILTDREKQIQKKIVVI